MSSNYKAIGYNGMVVKLGKIGNYSISRQNLSTYIFNSKNTDLEIEIYLNDYFYTTIKPNEPIDLSKSEGWLVGSLNYITFIPKKPLGNTYIKGRAYTLTNYSTQCSDSLICSNTLYCNN